MPKINLLPPEYKIERNVNLNSKLIKIGIFVIAALLTYFYIDFMSDLNEKKNQLAEIEDRLSGQKIVMEQAYKENKTGQDLDRIDLFIKGFGGDRVVWSQFITEIKENTPNGVILTEISTGPEDSFVIRGEAEAFSPVAMLYLNLKDSPNLADFTIQNVKKELTPDIEPVVKFEFGGQLRKGGGQ